MTEWRIRTDDLTGAATRALIAAHLDGMRDTSPPESVHALDAAALQHPDVTFWSAWEGDRIAGIAALKRLDDDRGELKSMRVHEEFLGRGVGRMLLRHVVEAARALGLQTLWLETGTPDDFIPAQRLYESEGFVRCEPFAPYVDDPFSVFFTRVL